MPRPAKPADASWTSSRCLRLLRSITSRLEPLRKLHARQLQTALDAPPEAEEPEDDAPPRQSDPVASSGSDHALPWAGQRTGRIARDYSARYRNQHERQQNASAKAQEPSTPERQDYLNLLPTPFRDPAAALPPPRYHPLEASSPPDPSLQNGGPDKSFSLNARRVKTHHAMPEEQKRQELEWGLFSSLSVLLYQTAPLKSDHARPSRLFTTCLRAVPTFIASETLHLKSIDPDDKTDVASAAYDYVESLGYSPRFAGLREVVRAHSLQLISQAIQDGIFRERSLAELLNVVLILCTPREKDRLLLACASVDVTSLWSCIERHQSSMSMLALGKVLSSDLTAPFWVGMHLRDCSRWLKLGCRLLFSRPQHGLMAALESLFRAYSRVKDQNRLREPLIVPEREIPLSLFSLVTIALAGAEQSSDDVRFEISHKIRTMVAVLALQILCGTKTRRAVFSEFECRIVVAALVLQCTAPPQASAYHASIDLALVATYFASSFALRGTPQTNADDRTQVSGRHPTQKWATPPPDRISRDIVTLAYWGSAEDPDKMCTLVETVISAMLQHVQRGDDSNATGALSIICVATARRHLARYPSLAARRLMHRVETALDDIDDMAGIPEGMLPFGEWGYHFDESLREWIVQSDKPSRAEAVPNGRDAVAAMSRGKGRDTASLETPTRHEPKWVPFSPDELGEGGHGSGMQNIQSDAPSETAQDLNSGHGIAPEPDAKEVVSLRAAQQTPLTPKAGPSHAALSTAALASGPFGTRDEEEEGKDELAFSARKRPAPHFTAFVRQAKRPRRSQAETLQEESEDELG